MSDPPMRLNRVPDSGSHGTKTQARPDGFTKSGCDYGNGRMASRFDCETDQKTYGRTSEFRLESKRIEQLERRTI